MTPPDPAKEASTSSEASSKEKPNAVDATTAGSNSANVIKPEEKPVEKAVTDVPSSQQRAEDLPPADPVPDSVASEQIKVKPLAEESAAKTEDKTNPRSGENTNLVTSESVPSPPATEATAKSQAPRFADDPKHEPVPIAASGDWVEIPNKTKPRPGALSIDRPGNAPIVGQSRDPAATTASTAPLQTDPEPFEPLVHIVQKGENFWTISRRYYGSGRFYKALWAANRDQFDAPEKLFVSASIRVPPPESLDRKLIDPPQALKASASSPASKAPVGFRTEKPHYGRFDLAAQSSEGAEPAPRSRDERIISFEDVPIETPSPRYQVRKFDTLRSIARDTLGDSRRARRSFD